MLATGAGRTILLGMPKIGRAEFLAGMSALLGAGQRLLYAPNGTDTTSSVESSTLGQTLTWDATIAGRVSPLGNGFSQSWAGTQYGDIADTANLTFGNGVADQPLTFLALVNATETAGVRTILAKFGASSTGEYRLTVSAANKLTLFLTDASASVNANRASVDSVNVGAWALLAATYDGTGGATAMNGVSLYQNGALMASTANNNASYVAMEDAASPFEFGSQQTHTANFVGGLALLGMTQGALTQAQIVAVRSLCRRHFGVAL